ncbi:hypothetical protein TOPH_04658 [Tolypocladium ophioglossoides CBS 100239]|uniref:Alpha-1,2-mannosyltransferase n=1 Tax=Tolypocladium ophioglossoides (strain CBS 100239) TaxID=1163406 RepID=A0A0L0NA02_TOLOC|nr:hypothetical protein TOPH_04658 [Tolypocladium ophioglossoides CBS 100239]
MAILQLIAAVCVGTVAYFLYNLFKHRNATRVRAHSFSSDSSTRRTHDSDYTSVFPPSQRHVLGELLDTDVKEPSRPLTTESLVKMDADYRHADPASRIFSGFTVGEVKALGNFPDYAKLSGVPGPSPLKGFDVDSASPRPYRPFRWAYHQTMSFQKLDPDYWIELESTYRERIVQRRELYAQHGSDVLQALPGSELACKELMEMVLQYICARYPDSFRVDNNVLYNNILGTSTDLEKVHPLHVLLHNVPEDFAITLRNEKTGRYHFRAGVVLSTLGWKLSQKIGLELSGIHAPVPSYKEKMAFSMDRFFTRMPAPSPIQRGSWGLEIGQPLFLPTDHADWSHRDSQNPSLRPDDLFLRVDWQTLRRLPLSGGIVFNFKALFTPLTQFQHEPYVPLLVLKILSEGEEGIMRYKGTWHVEHIARPALEEYARAQLERGLVEKDWTERTLDEYPFFPGYNGGS